MSRNGSSALLFATMFPQTVMSMMVLTPPVVADHITEAYNLPAEIAGIYPALSFFFVAIGTLSTSALVARMGPLRLSFACIVAGGGALALFGIESLVFVLLATALMGICYGPLTPASQQAIANGPPITNLALFLSIRQSAVPFGGMLAGLIVPPLVLWSDFGTAMALIGGVVTVSGLALGSALGIVRREQRPPRAADPIGLFASFRLMLRNRALFSLSCASIIYGALQLIVSSLLVVFLMHELGRDLVTAGIMLGISQAAAVIGRIGWGFLADRLHALTGTLAAVGVGMAAACAMTFLMTPQTPNWVIGIVAFVLGGTASGWNGVFLANLMRLVPPEQAGAAASGALLFSYVGILLGPPLFGATAALVGFSTTFLLFGGLALWGAALCWRVAPAAAK